MSLWKGPSRWADGGPDVPVELSEAFRDAQSNLGTADQVGRIARRISNEMGRISNIPPKTAPLTGQLAGILSTKGILSILGVATVGSVLWWPYVSEMHSQQNAAEPHNMKIAQEKTASEPADTTISLETITIESSILKSNGANKLDSNQRAEKQVSTAGRNEAPKAVDQPKKWRRPRFARSSSIASKLDPESELIILTRAQDVLSRQPKAALAITYEHLHEYPTGVFAQEREMIAIEALFQMNQQKRGIQRAARFLKDFSGSTHAPRVRSLLEKARRIEELSSSLDMATNP